MSWLVIKTRTGAFPGWDTPYEEEVVAAAGGRLVRKDCRTEDTLIDTCGQADAIITANEPFTARVVDSLFRCRLIANCKTGYDNVVLDAATRRGVLVSNVPDYGVEEVSTHAMALLLACARKLLQYDTATREGKWMIVLPPVLRLSGQTLGIIGLGRIGKALVHSPHLPPEAAEGASVEMVELEQLLRESDFVSLHTSLTLQKHRMLQLEHFRLMKPTAYLINTARGQLVDEPDLYTALKEGIIAGAGLDVLDTTDPTPPRPDNPILTLPNVIFSAHSAHYSAEAFAYLVRRPAEEVARVLNGGLPENLVNPEAKEAYFARWGGG
ncbi:MAG: C-terminal binding protein [Dehalococcoidia bacterium]|jgi:D-3-phosphoglycerate dehydrogenase|nr:C-terminal binding protein [Dehalococcoidia bacterium]MDP7240091.1 C-terminal binding protein [Dehalococcoidia bacterium]